MKNVQKNKEKYCEACGKELVKKVNITSYNKYTGKKEIYHRLVCPNWLCETFRRHGVGAIDTV